MCVQYRKKTISIKLTGMIHCVDCVSMLFSLLCSDGSHLQTEARVCFQRRGPNESCRGT